MNNPHNDGAESLFTPHKILIYIIASLIFFVPFNCRDDSYFDFANLAQEVYIQSICGIFVFIWLLDCLLSKKWEIKWSNLYWPILGILLWSVCSLFWTLNKPESLDTIYQWVACGVMFFVVYNILKTPLEVTIIMLAIFLSMAVLIIIGYFQFFNESFSLFKQVIAPGGSFGNKNMFSDYLVITLPICFYFFMGGKDKNRLLIRIASAIIFLGGVCLIVLSKTRAGILSMPIIFLLFLVGLAILFYLGKERLYKDVFSKQKVIILIVFSFLLPLLFTTYFIYAKKPGFTLEDFSKRINSIYNLPTKDKQALNKSLTDDQLMPVSDSSTIRWMSWANTVKMIQDKPIQGFGLNNWQIHYADYRRAYYNDPSYQPTIILAQVHNDYLQLLVELGLIGFLFFAWFVFGLFFIFKRLFFSLTKELDTKLKAFAILLCLFGFGLSCFFSFLLFRATPSFLLFVYGALMANLFFYSESNSTKNNHKVYCLPTAYASFAMVPVIILSIYVVSLENTRTKADKLYKLAMDNSTLQRYEAACLNGEEILRIYPHKKRTHFIVGNAYMSLEKYELAIEHMEKGLQYYPKDLMALFQIGTVYIKQLKKLTSTNNASLDNIKFFEDKTIYWYDKALKIRGDFSKVWNNLGFLYERRSYRYKKSGNELEADSALTEAEKCFDKAIKYDGLYSDALLNKSNVMIERKNYAVASELAQNVIKQTYDKFQELDKNYQSLISNKTPQNSNKFIDALTKRSEACQDYILFGSKAVALLKVIYFKSKQIEKILSVLESERNIVIQKAENQRAKYEAAFNDYQLALKDPSSMREDMSLEDYKNIAEQEKAQKEKISQESFIKIAAILIDNADVCKYIGNNNDSLLALQKVIELSKSRQIPEQESLARLKMNETLLTISGNDLPSKFSLIEENFEKATHLSSKELFDIKKQLEAKYQELKNSFK